MIKNKAYKFRLYPNQEQKAFLAKSFGCSRFVYNHFLRLTIDTYAESKQTLKYRNYAKLLTLLKKETDYSWLKEVNSQSLQQSPKDLEKAFVAFFSKQNRKNHKINFLGSKRKLTDSYLEYHSIFRLQKMENFNFPK